VAALTHRARALGGLARAAQRRLREVAPAPAAELTWRAKRARRDRELRLVERLAPRGGVALDVGANWGLFAHRLARLVGPSGHVHAFEPNPAHRGTLTALARRHPNLTVHLKGVSDRAGRAELSVPVRDGRPITALGSFAPPAGVPAERVRVDLTTLDAELDPFLPVGLIKCDVEGHELPVLRGAERTLGRRRPPLLLEIEARHPAADPQATFAFLQELGYSGWCLRREGLAPLSGFDLERDQLAFLGDPSLDAYDMPEDYVNDFLFLADRRVIT
jgi:FkbM family methyltransferase